METSLPQTTLNCTQCGGELHPDEGQIFVTCPFCNSTVYLDKSQVVFHWYIAPTLDEAKARGSLRRWMSSSRTVKDLDQKSNISEVSFSFFPLWYSKLGSAGGKEQIAIRPAAATAVSEIRNLHLPAGDLRRFAQEVEGQSIPPSLPLQAAREWIVREMGAEVPVLEQALVHVPLYTFKYSYQGGVYTAVVEGATGEVFANIYPAKAETPYRLAGALSALVFLCLALFPIAGALVSDTEGAGVGLLLCIGIGLIAGPALFALAIWVAAKV